MSCATPALVMLLCPSLLSAIRFLVTALKHALPPAAPPLLCDTIFHLWFAYVLQPPAYLLALQVKMETSLKPEALDRLERQIAQLDMEDASLARKATGERRFCSTCHGCDICCKVTAAIAAMCDD